MSWYHIGIHCRPDSLEAIEASLQAAGAQAIMLYDAQDQPLLEPGPGETPLWDDINATGLFSVDTNINAVMQQLQTQWPEYTITQSKLAEQNWTRAWMDHYHPMQFADKLWICPTTVTPPDPDAVNVMLDPGMAFGTGTHPTTAMCLQWLGQHNVQGCNVIDYGCGSGVLAIAALKLGAQQAHCIDNDPQALIATEENAIRNGIAKDNITITLPELTPPAADIVIANILASALINLAPALSQLVKPCGQLILSGILADQAESVIAAYAKQFSFEPLQCQQEWVCLSARKRA